ncbi:MAG: DUF3990 domain-containing protein [Hespellia sp.]|nr:DUF3990 domain-containing protein [Hespellia sp.]
MEKSILYHGSNIIVPKPKILINGHYKDFGYGFYCTNIKKQAKRWAFTRRLISDTAIPGETEVEGILRVYNRPLCAVIDNYNCSAYYEPSYVIARAHQNGSF